MSPPPTVTFPGILFHMQVSNVVQYVDLPYDAMFPEKLNVVVQFSVES